MESVPLSWGIRPRLAAVPLGAAVLAVLWCVLAGPPEDRLVAGLVAVALLLTAGVALRYRRRLTADADGFVIRTVFGQVPRRWDELARVSTPTRRRRGLSTTTLELDLVDDTLIVLGRLDLGTDPAEVAAVLRTLSQQGKK